MDALDTIGNFIFIASLKGSVLILVVLALQALLGRVLPANWRYLLWFTVVIALVTPLGFEAPVLPPAREARLAFPQSTLAMDGVRTVANERPAPAATPSSFSSPATAVRSELPVMTETLPRAGVLLTYLWLAGVLTVAGTIALSTLRFAALLRRARPAPAMTAALLRDCMQQTGCRRPVTVLQSADVDVPMIAGQFRPVLLLPLELEAQLTSQQLRHVFIHELMHLQRGDIVGNWIIALVQALHWFNPVVWLAFFRMRQDRELACDAATLRHLARAEHAAYGHTLLQLNDKLPGLRVPGLALGMLHGSSPLHRRILMLAESSRHPLLRHATAAVMVLPLTALAFTQPVSSPSEEVASPAGAMIPAGNVPPATEPTSGENRIEDIATPPTVAGAQEQASPIAEMSEALADAAIRAEPSTTENAPPAAATPVAAAVMEDARPGALAIPVSVEPPAPEVTVLAAVVDASPTRLPAASYAGLDEIERLAATLAATKDDKLRFIDKWNAMGQRCEARREGFLGALSASCQRIRTAQRRGEMFRFGYECYQMNVLHEQQVTDYRASAVELASVEAALRANERELAQICSKATHESAYPAFAAMMADAEALKYYPSRQIVSAGVLVQRMDAEVWRNGSMTTASSMFPSGAGTTITMEQNWSAMPTASADFGGFNGGGAETAPAAPQ